MHRLGARLYEIWTDVHGMFTCDPRHVPNARLIEEISYREAQELAAMGAKVLHPRCLGPAAWGSIPVEVHNTMDPTSEHRKWLSDSKSGPSCSLRQLRRAGALCVCAGVRAGVGRQARAREWQLVLECGCWQTGTSA